jgi:MFS family permease
VVQAFRDMVAGAVYLWRRRIARDALAAQTSHRFFYGLWTVTAVLLERNLFEHRGGIFHGGAAGLGELVVATGAGSVTAAVVTPWITRRVGTQSWIVIALICGGGGLVALGLLFQPGALVAAALVLGFVGQATKVCTDTIVQRNVEDAFRGRAFAFYDQLFNIAYVAAAAVGAALLPSSGRSVTILCITGLGYVLTAIAFAVASAQLRMAVRR